MGPPGNTVPFLVGGEAGGGLGVLDGANDGVPKGLGCLVLAAADQDGVRVDLEDRLVVDPTAIELPRRGST